MFADYLRIALDDGEAESIALAREINANVILIDERDARDVAKSFGFHVLGTIGLLIWAKQSGHIIKLKELLDKLQNSANFRLSDSLYTFALHQANE